MYFKPGISLIGGLIFLLVFLVLLIVYFDPFSLHLNFLTQGVITAISLVLGFFLLKYFPEKQNLKPDRNGKPKVFMSHKYIIFSRLAILAVAVISGLVYRTVFGRGVAQSGYIFLIFMCIPLIFGLYLQWRKKQTANSIFYVLANLSPATFVMISLGAIGVLIIYTYAQCQAFGMEWSLECVANTFGK